MSLFVNPAQFGPGEDLESYPRDEARDRELAEREGVDLIYAPPVEEVYPEGFATSVEVGGGLTEVLCGAPEPARRRPLPRRHHRGREAAQLGRSRRRLLRPEGRPAGDRDQRMVRDLDFPVQIEVLPTVREPDGLAMSSRNAYLSPEERRRAAALIRALRAAEAVAASGETRPEVALDAARAELERAGIEPEYLEARDAEGLAPAESLNGRPVLVAVAARVGQARLIDNLVSEARNEGQTDRGPSEPA